MCYIQSKDDPNGLAQLLVAEQAFQGRPDDRGYAISIYNKNVEEVIATIAPERMLIHSLGDGWQPLCDWLGLPVPDIAYPSGNSTQELVSKIQASGVDLSRK